jgi:glucose-fructose oxidoreductase
MAAEKGFHVLCEKPMATSVSDCNAMIKSSEKYNTKLMIAYRLHFDPANLKTIQITGSDHLGDVRLFNSVFTMQVTDTDNIRLKENMGGGTLYDIGIYCINAARYIFRDEPMKVSAVATAGKDKRFSEVYEMVSATMRFPKARLATFTCSLGAHEEGFYEVVGTHGSICLENAYDYVQPMKMTTSIRDKQKQYT